MVAPASVVLWDAGPLGLLSNPKLSREGVACTRWLHSLLMARIRVIVPEIADYEIRRELLRANKLQGLTQLDAISGMLEYLPINTLAMRRAAELWAQARQHGQPTANDKTIDADMILSGQALTLEVTDFVIATTNVGHLSRWVRYLLGVAHFELPCGTDRGRTDFAESQRLFASHQAESTLYGLDGILLVSTRLSDLWEPAVPRR